MDEHGDSPAELSDSERARLRHRDRKRITAMVVDNAGVRRTQLALAQRRRQQGTGTEPDPPPQR